jgi:hypothetical protein
MDQNVVGQKQRLGGMSELLGQLAPAAALGVGEVARRRRVREISRPLMFQMRFETCLDQIHANEGVCRGSENGGRSYVNGATRRRVRAWARMKAREVIREERRAWAVA